jgi:hypothetical protein
MPLFQSANWSSAAQHVDRGPRRNLLDSTAAGPGTPQAGRKQLANSVADESAGTAEGVPVRGWLEDLVIDETEGDLLDGLSRRHIESGDTLANPSELVFAEWNE